MASLLQTSHAYATPRYISPTRPITSSFSRQRLLTRNLSFRNRPPCSFPIFGWKIRLFASCRGNLSVRSVYSDRERNKKEESERPRFDINLAVVLAGFSFEAYTTPPRNIGRLEVDGAGCKTVYLSESFVREIYDGQLFIKLKKGIDLPAMDPWGTSDPYVVMQLDGQVAKSKIKWGKKEPTWNQKFKFNIKRLPNKNLQVAVWDANLVTPHKRMGNAIVNLEAFYNGDLHDVWVELEGMGGGGKLQMEVRYKTFEEIDNEKRWWKLPFVSKYLQKDRIRSAFNNVVGSEGVQARQFVEFAFGRLKSFNGLYLSKDQVLRRNGSQVVDYSEKTPVSDTVLENGDTPELSVQEANSSEDSKVELSPSDNESLDGRPVELETPNSEAALSYKHFWKSLADSMNEKVKHKLGLPASMDLKWEAYELLTSIGLQLQKIAEAGYVESGLATPEGQDRDADNNRRPLSIGAIQSSLPDIKKATEELVTQTDSVLRALMVLTETISKLNKEARDLEKSSSESEKLSPLNSAALDEKKAEEMRALFSTAESAMEAWAMLSASLGHPSFVKSEFEKLCFLDHASTDTQVVVWRDSARRRLVVSFRGTDQSSWKDFRTDFMIAPVGLNPERIGGDFQQEVQVHSGFLKAYDSVRTKLVSVIKRSIDYRGDECEPPNKWRVYLTGHSLGGALATLLALELSSSQLVKKGAISIAMYNFGSPRVGNKRFAEVYNERVKDSWRVVNHRDIIPTVPHLMGYCHVAQPLYLVAGGLEDALENLDILKDGYEVDVVGEYTPDVLVNEFMKGEKELIEKILQTEINIFRSIRDGTALMQHMEDFYYISLLEHVRANYQIPTLVERTKQI